LTQIKNAALARARMRARPTVESHMSKRARHARVLALPLPNGTADAPDTPFAEDRKTEISEDLRHRLISDLAYARYCARGYADGYDLDDWLEAEAEVDHMRLDGAGREPDRR
jgi:hypothetical protein